MLIRSIDTGTPGIIATVTAEQAGWDSLNMTVRRMSRGERWSASSEDNEYVHVLLSGQCHIRATGGDFLNIGRRANVFSGMPYAVYLSRNTAFEIEALTEGFEVASCCAPTEEDHPAHLVTPAEVKVDLRGGSNASRQVNNIIPPGFDCQRIVCVEAYIPGGNWAGYPPHKHDVHREDAQGRVLEADLEEIYFYKMDRPEGFAYQRIYTADGKIDNLILAQHHDTVLIHEGYHPTVSAHGYTTYLLNFLAGSAQSLANSDDPAHAWVKQSWGELDPRLPIVSLEMET